MRLATRLSESLGLATPLSRALPAAALVDALNNEAIAAVRTLATTLKE